MRTGDIIPWVAHNSSNSNLNAAQDYDIDLGIHADDIHLNANLAAVQKGSKAVVDG